MDKGRHPPGLCGTPDETNGSEARMVTGETRKDDGGQTASVTKCTDALKPEPGSESCSQQAVSGTRELGARTAEKSGEKKARGAKSIILETFIMLALAFIIAVVFQSFFLKAFLIPSSSMNPTLQIGDRIMVEKVTYYFRKPKRGDIIVFRYPPQEPGSMNTSNPFYWPFEQMAETFKMAHRNSTPYVKRVVAVEGETVEVRKGKLYVDGKYIREEGIVSDGSDFGPVKVSEGNLFCMGDNRPNSRDSRAWGCVPERSVIGRVFLIWWPPGRWGIPR